MNTLAIVIVGFLCIVGLLATYVMFEQMWDYDENQ